MAEDQNTVAGNQGSLSPLGRVVARITLGLAILFFAEMGWLVYRSSVDIEILRIEFENYKAITLQESEEIKEIHREMDKSFKDLNKKVSDMRFDWKK